MLNELKSFDANRMSLEELVAIHAFGRALQVEFTELEVDPPEWVGDRMTALGREIENRNADRLQAKLRDAKVRFEALKTPTEKKASLAAEISRLEKRIKQA